MNRLMLALAAVLLGAGSHAGAQGLSRTRSKPSSRPRGSCPRGTRGNGVTNSLRAVLTDGTLTPRRGHSDVDAAHHRPAAPGPRRN